MNTSSSKKVTVVTLRDLKAKGEKIACLTAYDYSFAAMLDSAGMDMIMVGDSLGMVIQGHETCLPVTLEEVVYHSKCVSRGTSRALLISDLPFGCYQLGPEQACESAIRVMQDGGAEVVKLEGGVHMADTIEFLTTRGIPVCAHIGLTPQSVHSLGGFRVQGRGDDAAEKMREDAVAVEDAGASLVVLEAMPAMLAKDITAVLSIPTIGIGAGADCDGQVLVLQDAIGIYPRKSPKFCRNFMDDTGTVKSAVTAYIEAVKTGAFPAEEHTFN